MSFTVTKDIDLNQFGQLETLTGINKLKHLVFKALVSEEGSNELIPNYGSRLFEVIGQKFDALAEFKIHNAVENAVRFLIEEQAFQPALPLDETILGVSSIKINQDFNDPRVIMVVVEIKTGNFQTVPVNINLVND